MGRLGLASRGVDLPANAVYRSDGAGAEVALTVAEDRLVGRIAGGDVAALTPTQARTLLGVTTGSGGAPNTWYATDYAGVDPSGTTDSLAGLNLWWADVTDHDIAVIPPGRYRLSGTLNLNGKSATIIMDGVTLIGTTTSGLLQIAGTLEATQTVSALTERKTTSGEYGNGGANMWVVDFTIPAGAPAWKKGDFVWVTADDLVPPASATVRVGQPMIVLEVSGTRATCMGALRDSFTTNIRMARYAVNSDGEHHRVTLRGGPTLTWTDAILNGGTATNYALRVKALIEPVVSGVTVLGANGQAIEVKNGTYGALIADPRIRRADDETGVFGYGVNDSGYCTRLRGMIANRVRHGYTTGAAGGISANTADLLAYGRADGFEVVDSLVEGASETAYDCHGDGIRGRFARNRVRNCRGGIGLRGVQYVIDGLIVEGGCNSGAITVDTTSSSADAYGSVIKNVVIDDISDPDNGVIFVRSTSGFESRPTWIDDIWLRSTDDGAAPSTAMLKVDNATVKLGRLTSALTGMTWVTTVNGGVVEDLDVYVPPDTGSKTYSNTGDGTDGATITNSNSGVGGTAFSNTVTTSSGSGTRTFSAAASMVPGETGIRCTGGVSDTGTVGYVFTGTRSLKVTGRVRFSANPTTDSSRFVEIRSASAVACAVGRTTAGMPGIKGSGASATLSNAGATALPTGVWLHFEVTVVGDTNNTDGVLECVIYRFPGAAVPLYSVLVTNLAMGLNGADITQLKFGKCHTAPGEGNIDLRNLSVTYDVAIS